MGFILGLTAVVAVLASILLMLVVLLQEPKGGGLAAALGGSGMEAIGPSVGGVNRFTSWVAAVWMIACFVLAVGEKPGVELTVKKPNAANTQTPGDGTQKPGDTPPAPEQPKK